MSILRPFIHVFLFCAVYSMACQGSQPPRRAVVTQNGQNGRNGVQNGGQNGGANGQNGQNGKPKPPPEDKKKQEFLELYQKILTDIETKENNGQKLVKADLGKPPYSMDAPKLKQFEENAKKYLPKDKADSLLQKLMLP